MCALNNRNGLKSRKAPPHRFVGFKPAPTPAAILVRFVYLLLLTLRKNPYAARIFFGGQRAVNPPASLVWPS